jgi:hypothetical protein
MIVGYGFGDEHVNAVIADAVEYHDLKVFIWDTGPNLMDRVRAAPHGGLYVRASAAAHGRAVRASALVEDRLQPRRDGGIKIGEGRHMRTAP